MEANERIRGRQMHLFRGRAVRENDKRQAAGDLTRAPRR